MNIIFCGNYEKKKKKAPHETINLHVGALLFNL